MANTPSHTPELAKPKMLLVGETAADFVGIGAKLSESGYDVIRAGLIAQPDMRIAEAAYSLPAVNDVLDECASEKMRLSGILLIDPSRSVSDPYFNELSKYKDAALESYASAKNPASRKRADKLDNSNVVHGELPVAQTGPEAFAANQEALRFFQGLHTPSVSGTEFIKGLRQGTSPYRDLPVVVGNAHFDRVKEFLEAGADRVSTTATPLEETDGVAALDEVIKTRRSLSVHRNSGQTHYK